MVWAGSEKPLPTICYPNSTPMMLTMGLFAPVTRSLFSCQGITIPPSSHSLQMSKSLRNSFVVYGEQMGCSLRASRRNQDSKPPRGSHRGTSKNLPREINRKLVDAGSTEALLALIDKHLDDMNAVNMATALNR